MQAPVKLLHGIRGLLLRTLRWKTRGVKLMLFNEAGELLLVRNTYHLSHLYLLPGGGIRPFESLESAARREVREEAGVAAERIEPLACYHSEAEGRRDTIHLFTGRTADTPKPDGVEVEEARFFPLDALPANLSPATLRRIAEYRGERPIDGSW